MMKFPKKYNYKNIKNISISTTVQAKGDTVQHIYSSLLPSDQKLHPGCIYSLFIQDLSSHINQFLSINTDLNLGFGLSSNFYSKLHKSDINITHLETKVLKQLKQNKKFLHKLNLSHALGSDKDFVLSEQFNRYIRDLFVKLYQDQKIKSKQEIAYRSKKFQTNLFKNNIQNKEQKATEYSIKYFIDSKGRALTIPTTSLETIFADVAIVVNPHDKRYKKLIGQSVIIPIVNRIIPIIGDEDVDSFQGTGVFKVTPGHDSYGLQLAQKHGLPTDIFAIDTDGNFTKYAGEFAGKPVEEFMDNIIKYIDDIGNLDSTREISLTKKFDRHTGEQLDNILLTQWSIQYSYATDYLSEKLATKEIKVEPDDFLPDMLSILESKTYVNISNKSKKGILIPIVYADKGDMFAINDETIISRYKASKSKKDIVLTLIIANLILDNHLSSSFTMEELIDVLFAFDLSGEMTKLERYLHIYRQEAQTEKTYKKGLKDLQKLNETLDKDSEKVQIIIDLIKSSFALKVQDDQIYLDFATLFGKRDILHLQTEDSFSKSFVDSVRFLYKNNLSYTTKGYDAVDNIGLNLFTSIDQQESAINTALLALEYSRVLLFSQFSFHPILVDKKGNKIVNSNSRFLVKDFGENLDIYGPDTMRLNLLLAEQYDSDHNLVIFDTYKTQDYYNLLNKIRNASRFVYQKYILDQKPLKIKSIIKTLKSDITDYDLWIIHSIKTVLDDYEYQIAEHNTLELGSKILSFFKDTLCDKYLEASKLYFDKNTSNVIVFSFAMTLKMLKPYVPTFVGEIERYFNIDWGDYNISDFKNYHLSEKNYKINLLMDIISKFQKLKLQIGAKKHEHVDVFVQANPDFLEFLNDSNDLIKSLVNVSGVQSIRLHENIPSGYQVDNVININLGIKAIEMQSDVKKDVLLELKQERDDKLEHLQHLKSLIASVSITGNEVIIAQKREDIIRLQQEIDDLNFEITKLKAK